MVPWCDVRVVLVPGPLVGKGRVYSIYSIEKWWEIWEKLVHSIIMIHATFTDQHPRAPPIYIIINSIN